MIDSIFENKLRALYAAITADVTDFDASILQHGFLPKSPNDATKFWRGDGTYAVPGPFQPIFDYTVTGSAVSSITTSGVITLDGLAHGGYRFEFYIKNPAGGTTLYKLYANNDTTDANYHIFGHYDTYAGATNVSAYANPDLTDTGLLASGFGLVVGTITVTPDYKLNIQFQLTKWTGAGDEQNFIASLHYQTALSGNNLTRLDVVASVASKIDVGSRFRLWRNM